MAAHTFYIVDVFTENKYAGNQLAVFRNAADLTADEMQKIAREINFSETTFILSDQPTDGGFNVRIFTPREEVPFAGHPTIGTAHIIYQQILEGKTGSVILNLKAGRIPVTLDSDGFFWMHQIPPVFGPQHSPDALAPVLSVDATDLDERFPIEEVSTGLPFFIVPLKNLSSLQKASIDRDKYYALINSSASKGILVFCPETRRPLNHLSVRVFVDYYGVPEDPATGSANGCLAGYLVRHRYFGQPSIQCHVEQGYEIGRPSLLLLQAEGEGQEIHVSVGGKSIIIARGEFL